MHNQAIERIVDLTDLEKNGILNMTLEEARARLVAGDVAGIRKIQGDFALVAARGQDVLLARSVGRPLRYFITKRVDGPHLVVADRIDAIYDYLVSEGLDDQFHPSYTRMVPTHFITEVPLVGCPDPHPVYQRFFEPQRNALPTDIASIGEAYIRALQQSVATWLQKRASDGPIGVCFSGGIDSGSLFLVTYHTMLQLGMNPSRLKAFTLAVEGRGEDVAQSHRFLEELGLSLFLEPIDVPQSAIDWRKTVALIEDYKPLDVQAAAMEVALCEGIRTRYPDWKWLLDGDGGDENLKDYPIEANPELTIRSVFNNLMLYQEGWGVDSVKHSLTYSGGLSRGAVRSYAPASAFGFECFSPYSQPDVIEVAEGVPFIELTDWDHEKLYSLKGQIVAAGVQAVTGYQMPVYEKRRFQEGATERSTFSKIFPKQEAVYRRAFHDRYECVAG